jgi:hypothetical protein
MRKIICALNCSMFEPGQLIIEKGKEVESVYFLFEGYADIMNTYTINDGEGSHDYGYKIRLPQRSWFGDYQIMMGVQSTWSMVAGKKKGVQNSEGNRIKVMNIDGEMFRRYIDEYPDFRRFIILRSTVRRAYFNFRLKLGSFAKYLSEKLVELETVDKAGSVFDKEGSIAVSVASQEEQAIAQRKIEHSQITIKKY